MEPEIHFWFNGEKLSSFGRWWSIVPIELPKASCASREDVGLADVHAIACRIDHVGKIESADPDIFSFAVQEILYRSLESSQVVVSRLSATFQESAIDAYNQFIDSLFTMRALVAEQQCAFWTSGNSEELRDRLLEAMRCSKLLVVEPSYRPPPHIEAFRLHVEFLRDQQIKRLHRLGQSGLFDKKMRARLADLK